MDIDFSACYTEPIAFTMFTKFIEWSVDILLSRFYSDAFPTFCVQKGTLEKFNMYYTIPNSIYTFTHSFESGKHHSILIKAWYTGSIYLLLIVLLYLSPLCFSSTWYAIFLFVSFVTASQLATVIITSLEKHWTYCLSLFAS